MQNTDLATMDVEANGESDAVGVAARIAGRTLAARGPHYMTEVQRLLDAGREVMHRAGVGGCARVADIVTAAGLSNDAFYRHFRSKDELVAAILEDGTTRLRSYLSHQMNKASTPDGAIRAWVAGVLSQANEESAETTRSVLWNAGALDVRPGPTRPESSLGPLLVEPLTALGSPAPDLDASLIANAVIGQLSDHLRQGTGPVDEDVDAVTLFCLSAIQR